jgi:hypothetical protein
MVVRFRACLNREVRFRAVGRVVAPEPISVGRLGLRMQDTW